MSGSLPIVSVVLALALPWVVGSLLIMRLLNGSSLHNPFIAVGHGFFAGIFLVTLLIRLFDALHIPTTFATVSLATLLCGATALYRFDRAPCLAPPQPAASKIDRLAMLLIALLLALVMVRYSTLLIEITTRPLYAWDAWMNWAPKAVVWLHFGEVTPYVAPAEWLIATDRVVYSLGNSSASTYPNTVPLLYWWMMLATSSAENSLILLPWLLAPLALGCALYGHLRADGVSPLLGIIAFYALVNMPYVNIHSALAGYADIWMAAAFSLALLALAAREGSGELRWTMLCLFWCVACVTLKKPGLIFAAFMLFGLARVALRPPCYLELGGLALVVAFFAFAFTVGIYIDVPGKGHFKLDHTGIVIPAFGTHAFVAVDFTKPLLNTLLGMLNWNLLFYLVPLAVLSSLARPGQKKHKKKNAVLVVFFSTAFLGFIYAFTSLSVLLHSYVTINRSLLYLIPGVLYLLLTVETKGRVNNSLSKASPKN